MAKTKNQVHREWFRTVSMGGRKSCPNCKAKLADGESIWQWGEYVRAKWRNVLAVGFCRECFEGCVGKPLRDHAGPCGCKIELVGYQGTRLPAWLDIPAECKVAN